jgi:hypothetical protein
MRAFAIACFGWAVLGSAGTAQTVDDMLYQQFGSAVFYIETAPVNDPTNYSRAGTATLIDHRGYFVTASHVFASGFANNAEMCDKRQVFDGVVRLTNEDGSLILPGREISGAPAGHEDISLIQTSQTPAGQAVLDSIRLPDLVIGDPQMIANQSRNAVLLGYPWQAKSIVHPVGNYSWPGSENAKIAMVIPYAFNGQSGGPAITPGGRLIGVLSGPEPRICDTHIQVTQNERADGTDSGEFVIFTQLRSSQSRAVLFMIPPDEDADAIQKALAGDGGDTNLTLALKNGTVRALSLRTAYRALTSGPANPQPASLSPQNVTARVALVNALYVAARNDGLLFEAARFLQFCPTGSDKDSLECNANAPELYTYIATTANNAAATGNNAGVALSREAMSLFHTLVEAPSRANGTLLSAPQKKAYSVAYALQAQILLNDPQQIASNPTLNATAKRLAAQAARLDPTNPNALLQQYRIADRTGNKDSARNTGIAFLKTIRRPGLDAFFYKPLDKLTDAQVKALVDAKHGDTEFYTAGRFDAHGAPALQETIGVIGGASSDAMGLHQ